MEIECPPLEVLRIVQYISELRCHGWLEGFLQPATRVSLDMHESAREVKIYGTRTM